VVDDPEHSSRATGRRARRARGGWLAGRVLLICATPASGGDAGRPAKRAQLQTNAGASGVSGRLARDRERTCGRAGARPDVNRK